MCLVYAPIDKRLKSPPFHGGVTGSNPVGSTTFLPEVKGLIHGFTLSTTTCGDSFARLTRYVACGNRPFSNKLRRRKREYTQNNKDVLGGRCEDAYLGL